MLQRGRVSRASVLEFPVDVEQRRLSPRNWFRDQCNAAGLKHCSFHGLRKAAATRLAEAGCTTEQIKAVTGHASLKEVARYTKAADQGRLARQALEVQLRSEGEQSAFGGKADMPRNSCPLFRSLLGVKQTSLAAAHMSAYDPKRT